MKDSAEDLSVRARRGELDENLTKQLGLLLSSSLEARLAHRAGREFDADGSVLPDDHALAERITERLLRTRPFAPAPSPKKPSLGPGVKAMLGAGALAAAVAAVLWGTRASHVHSAPVSGASAPRAATPANVAPPASTPSATAPVAGSEQPAMLPDANALSVSDPAVSPSAAEPRRVRPRAPALVAPGASASLTESIGESAASLFARANRARRAGDTGQALQLYQRLDQRFPSSPEALAAQIPQAVLKMQGGQANDALTHFTAYLERAPSGELVPEALWGQAQAWFSLGRPESARQALRLLLSKHPESAYAGAARAKLQAAK